MPGDENIRPEPQSYADSSAFTRLLGVGSRVRIIDVFLGKHFTELTAGEVAHLAGVDVTTVHRNIDDIIEYGLIEKTVKDGKAQRYQLNKSSKISQILSRAHDELMKESDKIPRTGKSQFRSTTRPPTDVQESLKDYSFERRERSADDGPRPSEIIEIEGGDSGHRFNAVS